MLQISPKGVLLEKVQYNNNHFSSMKVATWSWKDVLFGQMFDDFTLKLKGSGSAPILMQLLMILNDNEEGEQFNAAAVEPGTGGQTHLLLIWTVISKLISKDQRGF